MKGNIIIYPSDFSPCAKNAVNYVIQMAKATNSAVEIVHEIDVTGSYSASMISSDALNIASMLEEEAKLEIKKLSERFEEENIKVQSQIIIGNKLSHYLQNFESDGAVWIVMGTKGATNIENKIFGSIAHKIIREVNHPILVVPEKAKFEGIGEIVFASDYSETDLKQLEEVSELSRYFHSKLRVIHVSEGELSEQTEAIFLSDFETKVKSTIDYPYLSFDLLFANNVEDRLHTMIKEDHINLLVLVSKKRSFFERFFGKSLTQKMVYHTDIPMLFFSKE